MNNLKTTEDYFNLKNYLENEEGKIKAENKNNFIILGITFLIMILTSIFSSTMIKHFALNNYFIIPFIIIYLINFYFAIKYMKKTSKNSDNLFKIQKNLIDVEFLIYLTKIQENNENFLMKKN